MSYKPDLFLEFMAWVREDGNGLSSFNVGCFVVSEILHLGLFAHNGLNATLFFLERLAPGFSMIEIAVHHIGICNNQFTRDFRRVL
jgi:hypothetical protein